MSEPPVPEQPQSQREDVAPGLAQAAAVNRRTRRRGVTQTVIVCALLIAAIGYISYSLLKPDAPAASRITRGPNVDGTPAGEQQAESERYQRALDAANRQGANQAAQQGTSFVATPDQALRNVDDAPGSRRQPDQTQRPVAPANVLPVDRVEHETPDRRQGTARDDFRDINQLASMMQTQQASLLRQWSPKTSANTVVINQKLYKSPEQRQAASDASNQSQNASGIVDGSHMLVRAGQFLFGRTVNASDSDTPGPVVVEIFEQGPLYKARLLGQFQKNENTNALIVQFNRLVIQDGTELPTAAYAVDGTKGSIAVASDVDRRWLERYGPLLAGSFIEGLGTTLGRPNRSIVVGDNSTTIVDQAAEVKDAVYEGLGRVGSRYAGEIADSAPKGPLIKLDAGYTVGILFMQGVPDPAAGKDLVVRR